MDGRRRRPGPLGPWRGRRWLPDWLVPVPVAAAVAALYVRHANPVVGGGNTGELQVMGAVLGIAHPPSYPVYLLLAHAAARLPAGGDAAWRINVLTALLGAACVLLTGYLPLVLARGSAPGGGGAGGRARRREAALAGLVAMAALAAMPRFWTLAVEAEVFTLHLGLVLAFWLALARWQGATGRRGAAGLLAAGLLGGLGLAHHRTFLFVALAGALFVVLVRPGVVRRPGLVAGGLGAVALGLLPYLYVLRGLVTPVAFFEPDDVRRLAPADVRYVLYGNAAGETDGGRIVARLLADPAARAAGAGWLWRSVADQSGPGGGPVVVAGLAGAALLAARRPAWTLMSAGGAAGAALAAMAYHRLPQGDDADRYLLPLATFGALGLGTGVAAAAGALDAALRRPAGGRDARRALAGAALGLALAGYWGTSLGALGAPPVRRELYDDYVVPNLQALPPEAVLCSAWPTVWGWRYAQRVEHRRPDVLIVAKGTSECARDVVPRLLGQRPVYVTELPDLPHRPPLEFSPTGGLWLVVRQWRLRPEGCC